jgi:GNAT superfamily N-acetyltransferase
MSTMPPTGELVALGAPAVLRDGSEVRLRQGHHADQELLRSGFERLSPDGRYRRFLAATPVLTDDMVRYLTEIDHHDHEAIVATDERRGQGVGVARYVRDPAHPDTAEVAVTVIDEWQGRGLGTLLLEVLGARARAEGIRRFTAMMLASNQQMMEVLEGLGPVDIVDRDAGTVQIEIPIPQNGLAPALRKLLRIVARGQAARSGDRASGRPHRGMT